MLKGRLKAHPEARRGFASAAESLGRALLPRRGVGVSEDGLRAASAQRPHGALLGCFSQLLLRDTL